MNPLSLYVNSLEKEALASFRRSLVSLSHVQISESTEHPDLGALNFKEVTPLILSTVEMAVEMAAFPLEMLPKTALDEMIAANKGYSQAFTEIDRFRKNLVYDGPPSSNVPLAKQRDDLARSLESQAFNFLKICIPYYGFLKFHSEKFQESLQPLSQQSQLAAQEITKLVEQAKKQTESIAVAKEEAEAALQAAKQAAGETGIERHAINFHQRAIDHRKAARWWLVTTWAMLGLVALVAFLFMHFLLPVEDAFKPAVAQRIITKIVLLSTLYFAVLTASRNYRAHRHLAVVNEHRTTALQTFEAFVADARDEGTKNAVLLEATRCIFAPATTGYLGAEEDNPQNRIIEVLKLVNPSSGK